MAGKRSFLSNNVHKSFRQAISIASISIKHLVLKLVRLGRQIDGTAPVTPSLLLIFLFCEAFAPCFDQILVSPCSIVVFRKSDRLIVVPPEGVVFVGCIFDINS